MLWKKKYSLRKYVETLHISFPENGDFYRQVAGWTPMFGSKPDLVLGNSRTVENKKPPKMHPKRSFTLRIFLLASAPYRRASKYQISHQYNQWIPISPNARS